MAAKSSRTARQRDRLTIGLLTPNLSMQTDQILWQVLTEQGRARGFNALCYVGGHLRDPAGYEAQRTVLYDLAGAARLDGLIIFSGSVGTYLSIEEMADFCTRYHPLPLVSVSQVLPGIPSVMLDNYQGLHEALTHLIDVHGYRHIAYVRGPAGHLEADIRYQAYVGTLQSRNIPVDPALVVQGDFLPESGALAVRELLDERGVTFDALVTSNDRVAIRAMETLQARGLVVPQDVALIGFDDWAEASVVNPPLTTVRQPWAAIGARAVEMVLAQIREEDVRAEVLVPPELIVRQSCGCVMPQVQRVPVAAPISLQAASGETASEQFSAGCAEQRGAVLAAMADALAESAATLPETWAEQLLAAFMVDVRDAESGTFLRQLDVLAQRFVTAREDIARWHDVISEMRRVLWPCLPDVTLMLRAENLWQQARVLLGGIAERVQSYHRILASRQRRVLQRIEKSLIASFELDTLLDVVNRELPDLGIRQCYLSLYTDPANPTGGARLALAYDATGRVAVDAARREFPAPQVFPEGLVADGEPYALAVESLFFREQQLGFVLFHGDAEVQARYNMLQGQLSSGLKGALLVAQVEERARQLQATSDVAEAAGNILELERLMQEVVELVQRRFDLYHVGLYLIDAADPVAVLQAEAGATLSQAQSFEIGGASMVGACIAAKEARVAPGAGDERFSDAADLPETHSKIVLPLIARGQAVGALTIQSPRMNAFAPEDIAILQTMAGQLAGAIENARLLAETQQRTRELGVLNTLSQTLAARLDVAGVLKAIYTGAATLLEVPHLHIIVYDAQQKTFSVALYVERGTFHTEEDLVVSEETGLVGYVIRHREPLLIREDVEGWMAEAGIVGVGDGQLPRSWLGVPMFSGEQVLGAIVVQSLTRAGLYNEHDRDLLVSIAGHAAIALENARLVQRTQETLRETQLLYRASRALIASENPADALRSVVAQVVEALTAHRVILIVLDVAAEKVRDYVIAGPGSDELTHTPTYAELQAGLTGWAIRQREAVVSPKGQPDPRESPEVQRNRNNDAAGAIVVVPLLYGDQVLGTLTAINRIDQPDFTESDVDLMLALANQAAAALANAQLLEQTRVTLAETEALYRASQSLVAFADVDAAIQSVSDIARDALGALHVLLIIFDEDRQEILDYIYSGHTPELPPGLTFTYDELQQGLSGWAIRERQVALSRKGIADPRESREVQERRRREQAGAIIVAPLIYQDRILGTMTAVNHHDQRDFEPRDADLLMTLARQAAAALANARLLQQTRETLQEMEAVQRRYQEQAWAYYLGKARVPAHELTRRDAAPLGDAVLPEVRRVETERRPAIFTEDEVVGADRAALVVPSISRGQMLGAIGIHDDEAREWSEDEIAILEAVAERMAMTAENLRLLDETQRRAARERLTGEITARMRESLNMERVLQTAAREFGDALNAAEINIRLVSGQPNETEEGR